MSGWSCCFILTLCIMFKFLTRMLRLCEKGSEINYSLMDINPLIGIAVKTSVSGSKGESCLCKICWLVLTDMRILTPPGEREISLYMARAWTNLPDHQWRGKTWQITAESSQRWTVSLSFFKDSKASSDALHLIQLQYWHSRHLPSPEGPFHLVESQMICLELSEKRNTTWCKRVKNESSWISSWSDIVFILGWVICVFSTSCFSDDKWWQVIHRCSIVFDTVVWCCCLVGVNVRSLIFLAASC